MNNPLSNVVQIIGFCSKDVLIVQKLSWFVDVTRLFYCMNNSDLTWAVENNILRAAEVHGALIGNDLSDFGDRGRPGTSYTLHGVYKVKLSVREAGPLAMSLQLLLRQALALGFQKQGKREKPSRK